MNKYRKIIQEAYSNLSPEDKETIDLYLEGESVYDYVIAQIEFGEDVSPILIAETREMLKGLTRDKMVKLVWDSMNDDELRHFRDYFNQEAVIYPEKISTDVLLEFAFMYDRLMDKVNEGLAEFFENFVIDYNRRLKY